MQKALRFEALYDFKIRYEPPENTPVVDILRRSGQHLPCFEGGYLTLWLHEGTGAADAEGLAEMLNKHVRVVAYTVPPHKPPPAGYEAIVEHEGDGTPH